MRFENMAPPVAPSLLDPAPLTWSDLMKVHSSVRMPSPLLSSLTNRMTRKRRKKVMETRELSSPLCGKNQNQGFKPVSPLSANPKLRREDVR